MLALLLCLSFTWALELPPLPSDYNSPGLPVGPPQPVPDYMVNNQGNSFGTAPDKGTLDGPVISIDNLTTLQEWQISNYTDNSTISRRQSSNYWFSDIHHGKSPLAPNDYKFYRNVKDYGAKGDGVTDDTMAINRAVSSGNRCGKKCGSTTTLGAAVYFPPGKYMISSPIIQYYYTQFIGDANDKPTIKGMKNFTGIALIDTDVYIPGGDGNEWYINQNQFYRQIRNFKIDLTAMKRHNKDHGQTYVPTGIHWQVAQATSLNYIDFIMPVSDSSGTATAVGIFMENGSGGFVSDLTFTGGNIGIIAGTQQYTARNLKFTSCLTAISMIWDWGFTWKNIEVKSCYVALDCTQYKGTGGQGTGSITVLDSHFDGVPYAITINEGSQAPDMVLDNLLVENSESIVLYSGGNTIEKGSSGQVFFESWAMGMRYSSLDGKGRYVSGFVDPIPMKPDNLLDATGKIYERSKPQYENVATSDWIVATSYNIDNDGTGDQTEAINKMLRENAGTPIFFPAGIYQVKGTVFVPSESVIVGEGWSQIMGTGSYFADAHNPKVMVRVGDPEDRGSVEISDMLFTVKGPTAGAILMEWNIHEDLQGSAAMWDSHFRVGGADGTNLQKGDCPKLTGSVNRDCMAASLLLHMTADSSGYFENVWAWVADHDIDKPPHGNTTTSTQIDIYAARGVLIESQGPTWFYGSASEHSILYQYQLANAKHIYMGLMQTETPYFQPKPNATEPYPIGQFNLDPTFEDCSAEYCAEAFALRVLNSTDVLIYGAGFYSFFNNYKQGCLLGEQCQLKLIETSYSEGLWVYNLFTKGAVEVLSPDGLTPLLQADVNQTMFTSEVSVWLPLAITGADIGSSNDKKNDGSGIVLIDPKIFTSPSPIVQCWPGCTFVWPTSTLPSLTTFYFPPISTSTVIQGTTVTSISVPPMVTSLISFTEMTIPSSQTSFTFNLQTSLQPPPFVTSFGTITKTITPPAISTIYNGPEVVSISGTPYTVFGGKITVGTETLTVPTAGPTPTTIFTDGLTLFIPKATTTPSTTYYTLPTTTTVSDGVTYTWSEVQNTDYANITAKTTITRPVVETITGESSTTTTTTVIPIWLQVGGFWWSPLPLPTPPPVGFPHLPGVPPVPDPPCFTLLDIFTIDCPPDKSNPTTTFKPGPDSPTCTADCGTPDESETSSSSSSDCKTETQTTCQTLCRDTPCTTSCFSYVGCECPTKTVTDYYVSCSSTSCTTTSSKLVSGCYVTPTATTTGSYCPLVENSPDDDQGEDGVQPSVHWATITSSESVVVGGTTYPVKSGSVVIDGTTIPVPSVTAATTLTTDGETLTIFPGGTGISGSVSITSTSTSSSTTTSSTTSSPSNTPTGGPGGDNSPYFNIYALVDKTGPTYAWWYGFDVWAPSESVKPCADTPDWKRGTSDVVDTMPKSIKNMAVFDDTCDYTQTSDWKSADEGDKTGTLTCGTYSPAICVKSWGDSIVCNLESEITRLEKCHWP